MEWTLDREQDTWQLIEATFSLSWALICLCPLISSSEIKPAWLLKKLFYSGLSLCAASFYRCFHSNFNKRDWHIEIHLHSWEPLGVTATIQDISWVFTERNLGLQMQTTLKLSHLHTHTHRCTFRTTCTRAIKSSSSECWYHSYLPILWMWPPGLKIAQLGFCDQRNIVHQDSTESKILNKKLYLMNDFLLLATGFPLLLYLSHCYKLLIWQT